MRYALVDETGTTIGVILWDGETEYDPGEGLTLVPEDDAPPFTPDEDDAPSSTIDDVRAALAKATTIAGVKAALGPLLDAL